MEFPLTYERKFQHQQLGPRNEREELLEKFLAKLNPARTTAGYRAFTYSHLAKKLEGIPTADLFPFYKQCEQARCFGAFFHWALDPKNAKV